MAQSLANHHDEWTPAAIKKRSKQLAEAAAKAWAFIRSE